MRFLRLLRAALWSFLGIRGRAQASRDLEGMPAVAVIGAGLVLAMVFIGLIVFTVRTIAGGGRASETMTPTRVAAPAVPVRASGPLNVPDTMAERVRACVACHGAETQREREVFSPRIAGKPAGYLFNQLASFRDGRRTYAPMVYLVQYMDDEYLREIADYFAALELPHASPRPLAMPSEAIARAQELVRRGDAALGVPACTECHGAGLAGMSPAIPGLLGLPRDYISAQFGAWRNGRLRSLAPDCMADIARRLSASDVAGIASWLAAQPVPGNARPAPKRTGRLPMACGSVEAAAS